MVTDARLRRERALREVTQALAGHLEEGRVLDLTVQHASNLMSAPYARVWLVDGGSVLDASGLDAHDIVVAGRIDGGSTVKLNAPRGSVEFAAQVDGRSRLEVNAPDGTVTFSRPPARGTVGSKIDGESQVTITAAPAARR